MGRDFLVNHSCMILDGAAVKFGDHAFIGPNCCFTTAGHPVDPERRSADLEFARTIIVGSHVWFGANATVLPGVVIGDTAVIGAGAGPQIHSGQRGGGRGSLPGTAGRSRGGPGNCL